MGVLAYYTKVTNAVHSDYSAGFTPDYDWNEFNLAQNPEDTLLPLGSSDEFMLNKAITLITGTNRNTRNITMSSQTIQRSQPIYQSIDRHTTGGVLLCPIEIEKKYLENRKRGEPPSDSPLFLFSISYPMSFELLSMENVEQLSVKSYALSHTG